MINFLLNSIYIMFEIGGFHFCTHKTQITWVVENYNSAYYLKTELLRRSKRSPMFTINALQAGHDL